MIIGILGLGEVGSAIKKLTSPKHTVYVRELSFDEIGTNKLDVLHICIPFTQTFVSAVTKLIRQNKPKLTIIDATVKPGTTQALHQKTGANIVHAPIDGVHPHLYDYLFKFKKPIGAVNLQSYQLPKKYFEDLDVATIRFDSPLETELAKVLSTTYYGWNIIFEKYVHNLCQHQSANFDQVYTKYNQIYNQGYQQTHPHTIRPVLKHVDGKIGGHCVIPNAEIMDDWQGDAFTKFLLDQNKKL